MDFTRILNSGESGPERKDGLGRSNVDYEYLAIARGRSERVYRGMSVVVRGVDNSEAHEDRTQVAINEHTAHLQNISDLANPIVRVPFASVTHDIASVPPSNIVDAPLAIEAADMDPTSLARQRLADAYSEDISHVE